MSTVLCRASQTGGNDCSLLSGLCRESVEYTSYTYQLNAGAMASVRLSRNASRQRPYNSVSRPEKRSLEPAPDLFGGYPNVATLAASLSLVLPSWRACPALGWSGQ